MNREVGGGAAALVIIMGLMVAAAQQSSPADDYYAAPAPAPTATASAVPAYDRDAFGSGWADFDADGCNTRMEVLIRDLQRERVIQRCKVVSGQFRDPYTGVGGEALASVLDVDHVVSLGDAWRSGAHAWSKEQRRRFSNDERNLVATAAAQNRAKADQGPATWVPTNRAHHCSFARQVEGVKRHYRLTISAADRRALDRLLATCR